VICDIGNKHTDLICTYVRFCDYHWTKGTRNKNSVTPTRLINHEPVRLQENYSETPLGLINQEPFYK
jgi:hypothetical protein